MHHGISGESLIFTDQTLAGSVSIPTNIIEGDVVTISRTEEANGKRLIPLFIREHMVDKLEKLSQFLNHPFKWKLYMTGSPGCGKTCFFWMWADQLRQRNKRVLFVQYGKAKSCQIWVLECDARFLLTSPGLHPENTYHVVGQVIDAMTQEERFDVCICVGVRCNEAECRYLMSELDSRSGKQTEMNKWAVISKLVLVTSLQFNVKHGDEFSYGPTGYVANMHFDSWLLADYEMSVQSALAKNEHIRSRFLKDWKASSATTSEVNDDQKLLQAVRQKYHFAGGCARFMFEMSMEQLQTELTKLCDRNDNWAAFTATGMSLKTAVSVSALMQSFTYSGWLMTCTPVSKYVLIRAYDSGRSKVTNAVKEVASTTNNPTLRDWAFQLSQFDIISSALASKRTGYSRLLPAAAVKSSKLTFFPKAENIFNGSTIEGDVVNGSVIRGEFNQGVFETAIYFDKTLVSIQFTGSEEQALYLEFLSSVFTALVQKRVAVKRMVHLAIVATEVYDDFVFEGEGTYSLGKIHTLHSHDNTLVEVEVDKSEALKEIELFGGANTVQTASQNKSYFF